jgi:hypothetical protein
VVSQKNRILTPHYGNNQALHQMGVLSSFSLSESKTLDTVRGIGFGDQIAELVPSVTDPVQISMERALLYMCNLWQATGYASGVDGPVRSLKHHRWPFDIEQQIVFSTLVDADFGTDVANVGYEGTPGSFDGGIQKISYPQVTNDPQRGNYSGGNPGSSAGHSALITIFEACWFNSSGTSYSKDSGMVMETGDANASDVHDFSSVYGEFLATGNDPTLGQYGSIRYADQSKFVSAGGGLTGGGTSSIFALGAADNV